MIAKLRGGFGARRGRELHGLAGDSIYAAVWQGAASIADLAQIVLVTHALGLAEYGRLALVMSFVVLVGQFFDVRVGIAATTFAAGRVGAADWAGAAGVFRFGYAVDAVMGVAAFAIVMGLAPLVGPHLIGEHGSGLIVLYALTLLVSTVDETSISVLRVLDRFRLLAWYTVILEAFRILAVGFALLVDRSLASVLVALVAYQLLRAIVNWLVAALTFASVAGDSLWRSSFGRFGQRRAMLRTIFHTNFVSYARLAQVQLPTLLLGVLSTTTQVGLYKIGTAAGAIVGRVADPAYAAVLPRLSRLWTSGKRAEIRRLLTSATVIAAGIIGPVLFLVIVFRDPILRILGAGDDAVAAAPVLVLVGVAQAMNGVLFWNTGLLFAAGRSGIVSLVAVSGTLLQLALVVPLIATWDATGAAVALFVSLVVSNLVLTALAIQSLRSPPGESARDGGNHLGPARDGDVVGI